MGTLKILMIWVEMQRGDYHLHKRYKIQLPTQMCPLFFEAASSTPICCITNTTKPIFIIEKDYSSLSTQEETKQLLLESLCTIIMGLFLEERIPCPRKRDFMQIMSDPILQACQHNMYILEQIQQRLSIFLSLRVVITYETYRKRKISITFAPFHGVFLLELNNYGFVVCFFPPSWHLGVICNHSFIFFYSVDLLSLSLSLSLLFFVG